jgi:uncharacterized protein (TIGR02145 family)
MKLFITFSTFLLTVSLSAQCVGPECCAPGTIWDTEQQLCVVFASGDSNFDGCLATDDLLDFLSGFGDCNENSYDGPMFDCNGDGLITGIDNDCDACPCEDHFDCHHLNASGAAGYCDGCNCNTFYWGDCNYDGEINELDDECIGGGDGGGGGDCECESHFNCAHLNTETAVGVCDGCNCFTLEYGGLGGIIDCNGDGTIDGLDNDCNEVTDCNGDGIFNELDYDCLIELSNFQCGFDQVNYFGYDYNTVQIGTQCWFAENCKYLPSINFQNDVSDVNPKYYVQNFTSGTYSQALGTANYNLYGVLYNWSAVNAGYVCPTGWHVATEFEHSLLINHLGGESVAGHSLKSLAYWDGSNASGFEAMPGSSIGSNGQFDVLNIGNGGYLWSSSVGDVSDEGISYRLNSNSTGIVKNSMENENGLSVRCLYGDVVVPIYGCTSIGYCNYDATANVDDGSCDHWEDICGIPCGLGVPADDCDCNGNQLDDCGVCGGNNSSCFTECGNDMEYAGYSYSTVQIGTQCWYAENNRYLPVVSDINAPSYTSPRYYEYVNSDGYSAVLYNSPAVNSPDICPSGWHMPIDDEWQQLEMALGMSASDAMSMGPRGNQGLQLKSTTGWEDNGNGNNSSGFNAFPDGFADYGYFVQQDEFGHFWSLTESSTNHSFGRTLSAYNDAVYRGELDHSHGYSSRCLLDVPVPVSIVCGDDVNHENYDYSTVQIGSQCWFSENCRYLPSVSPSSEGNATDPYYYVYGYDGTDVASAQATSNYATYGVLYNWPAVMTEDICPSGWHIPSDSEFTQLTDFLGGESIAGGKMKEAGYAHWNSPNTGATNSSWFTGLPGGVRFSGGFYHNGLIGYWWSASESGSDSWLRRLDYGNDYVDRLNHLRNSGFSARCVRD